MKEEKGFFKGWYVVIAGLVVMTVVYAIVNNCISLFIKPVSENLGISRSAFSYYYTVMTFAMMFVALLMGVLTSKFKLKYIILVGCICCGLGFLLYSRATSLSMFYLISILTGLGLGMATLSPMAVLVNNWFIKKKGLAMGLVFMGSGLGGMIFNPIGNSLILNYGWRQAYLILGIIILVITIPVVLILLSSSPKDKGLQPFGYDDAEEKEKQKQSQNLTGFTFKECLKTAPLWMMLVSVFLASVIVIGIQMNVIPYLTDLGYSPTYASTVVSISLGVLVIGKISLGFFFDTVGSRKGIVIVSTIIFIAVASFILISTKSFIFVGLYVICWGLGSSMGILLPPLITGEVFGNKSYPAIIGVVNALSTLGSAAAPIIIGGIYDKTGSYTVAWETELVLIVIMAVLFFLAVSIGKKNKVKRGFQF